MGRKGNFIERSLLGALHFFRESVFTDECAAQKGFLQARDPRCKAMAVFFLLLAVLFSRNIFFIAAVYALCLLLTFASSIRPGFFLKRTWVFIPLFALFIAVPALFDVFSPGDVVRTFNVFSLKLNITRQGISSAVFFFGRVLTSVSLAVLLALTTRHSCLLKALRLFKVPQVFVMTLGMCTRYVYLFMEVLENTYRAVKSRVGFVSSVRKGQGVVAWHMASLWQRSYALHHDVYNAMLSRGYSGEPVVMDEFRATVKDQFIVGAAVLTTVASLWLNRFSN